MLMLRVSMAPFERNSQREPSLIKFTATIANPPDLFSNRPTESLQIRFGSRSKTVYHWSVERGNSTQSLKSLGKSDDNFLKNSSQKANGLSRYDRDNNLLLLGVLARNKRFRTAFKHDQHGSDRSGA